MGPEAKRQEENAVSARRLALMCLALILTAIVSMTLMGAAAPQEQTSRGFYADVSRISLRLARRARMPGSH